MMEVSSRYTENMRLMQQLKTNSSREAMQAPYSNGFETIYEQAQQSDIKLSNAKAFLNTLSTDQLSTLQHYTGLADEINVDALSDEGAYNLLMHDYEKYDFNNDGLLQDGISNKASIIPTNMSSSMKQSYVDALNSLDESQRFDAMTVTTLNYATLALQNADENGIGNYHEATPLTYDILAARVDSILHPTNGSYASTELQNTIQQFWENFQKSYNN